MTKIDGRSLIALILLGTVVLTAGEASSKQAYTERDFLALARKIEGSMRRGDASVLDSAIDLDAMLDKAMSGYSVDQKLKDGFRKGAKEGMHKNSFGRQILASMQKSGSYKFLRLYRAQDGHRLLFRLLGSDGGLNYHSMLLGTARPDGIRISDLYVYLTGELFSDTLRRGFLPLAYDSQRGFFEKILGWESDFVKNLPKVRKMQSLGKEGKPKEALQIYFELPQTLQQDKTFLLLRTIYASQAGNNKEYEDAMKEYQKNFPNDPSVDLVVLDAYVLSKKYGAAIQSINRINKSIGGDPYLGALRANVHVMDGKLGPAKESAQKAIADEPGLVEGYWSLVSVSLTEKNYQETARLLRHIEKKLGIELNDLKNASEYAGFVQSPEYREWTKSRTQR